MNETNYPQVDGDRVTWVSAADMIEVDRIMMEDLGIGLIQMMENAGRNLARLVLDLLQPSTVAVAVGPGGNGGGGLVAARHLSNAGVDVAVTTTRPADRMATVTARQLATIERMGIRRSDRLETADVVVDAVLGYSLDGTPRGAEAEVIRQAARAGSVVSLDTPSGLDVSTGRVLGVVVSAAATLTIALPKLGLRSASQVGQLYLADISVPPGVSARFGGEPPDFRASPILRLA